MAKEQRCKVIGLTNLNDTTYWLDLEVGDLVKEGLRAGQFVQVLCGEGNFLRRPISVALVQENHPSDTAALIFEVRGSGTDWLAQRVPGDTLSVLGPLGNGFTMDDSGRYLLVGGGIGVPPLLGYAVQGGKRTTAVLGFRTESRAILTKQFQENCEGVHLCSDDGTLGKRGYAHEQVEEILAKDKNFTAVLACGPRPMLKGVAQVAKKYGVSCQVSMEERMACGVGACLGCAIFMADGSVKHVCKDGPVFSAEEVDWNG